MKTLSKRSDYEGPEGPVVLIIMDGVGVGNGDAGDMVAKATKPHLDWLKEHALYTQLKAHGHRSLDQSNPTDSDMGNSEVGHNAIGAGRVFDQGALLVQNAVQSGDVFSGATWQSLVGNVKANQSTLHFIGLLSDGNVHSHIDILLALLKQSQFEGIQRVRIHTLL
ncbi:MAG: 2,3-bisphosphoglycerate-independent phosphoglycerate mutase, partial [Planctomycetota bacterium]